MAAKPRRPKNESGPAASGAYSTQAGDAFAAFTSFGMAGGDSTMGTELHSDFEQVFRRFNKKDAVTKLNACNELQTLITERSEDEIILAIPRITEMVRRRHYSKDKYLRRGVIGCIDLLFKKGINVKKKCIPHLKNLMPPWLCLCYDCEHEVSRAAIVSRDTHFNTADRLAQAFTICGDTLISGLTTLIDISHSELKDEESIRQQEACDVAENLHSSALIACSYLLEFSASHSKLADVVVPSLAHSLLTEGRLWKSGESKLVRERSATYNLIVSYLQKYPTELEVSDHQLTIFMQNVFSEKSTDVHRDMWPAVLLWVKQFPHGIKSIKNLHVTFLQKLFSFLRKGSGIAASSITYQSVYPLLALMGAETLRAGDEGVYYEVMSELLISLWNAVKGNTFPIDEFSNLVQCWVESFSFALNNTTSSDTAKQLVSIHLKHMINESIFGGVRTDKNIIDLVAKALVTSLNHSNAAAAEVVSIMTDVVGNIESNSLEQSPVAHKKTKSKLYERGADDWTPTEHGVLRRLSFLLSSFKEKRNSISNESCTEITVLVATVLLTRVSKSGNITSQVQTNLLSCWEHCLWDLVKPLLSQGYSSILSKQLLLSVTGKPTESISLESLVLLCNVHWDFDPESLSEFLSVEEVSKAVNATIVMNNITAGSSIPNEIASFSLKVVEKLLSNPTTDNATAVLSCCARLQDDDISKIMDFCLDREPSDIDVVVLTTLLQVSVDKSEVSGTGAKYDSDLLLKTIRSVTAIRNKYSSDREVISKFFSNWSKLATTQPNTSELISTATSLGEQAIRDCVPVRIVSSLFTMKCIDTTLSETLLVEIWKSVVSSGITATDNKSADIKFYSNCSTSYQTWSNALEVFVTLLRDDRVPFSVELLKSCFRSITVDVVNGSESHVRSSRRGLKCILKHCSDVDFVESLPTDVLLTSVSAIPDWDSDMLSLEEVIDVQLVRTVLVCSLTAQKMFVKTSLQSGNNNVLLLILETIKQSVNLLEKCDLTEFCPVIVEHAVAIAEKDEIGEDIPDDEILSAVLLLQWVANHSTDTTSINDAMPGLAAAASEKLQDEAPTNPKSLQHKLELATCLVIDSNNNIETLNEIASHVASIVQTYVPKYDFSWVSSSSDKNITIPTSAGLRRSLPGIKQLITNIEISVGSRAMLLAFTTEVLINSLMEVRSHVDDSVLVLSDFVCGLSSSVLTMLNPGWSDVLYEMYSSLDTKNTEQKELVESDFDVHINNFFEQHRLSRKHILLSVTSRLAVFTESNFGMTTEGEERAMLPEFLNSLVQKASQLGQQLLPDPGRESHQNYKSLSKARDQFLRPETLQNLHEYLISWHLILKILDRAMEEDFSSTRISLIATIKETEGMLQRLMGVLGGLLLSPREEVISLTSKREIIQYEDYREIDIREALVSIPMGFCGDRYSDWIIYLSVFDCQAAAGLGSIAVLRLLLSCLPSAPRRWVTVCDPTLKAAVNNFVQGHLSPELIKREFDFVIEKGGGKLSFERCDELTVKVQPGASSVVLNYDYQDTIVVIKVVVPPSFPLSCIHHPPVEAQVARQKAGLREDVWRRWLLQMTVKLNSSARLWDCVILWQQNLSRHFDGQEPCPICYTVVNAGTQQLPSMECTCCHGKYHKLCLYKWFKKSNNSTCPLCRAAWYSNPEFMGQ